MPPINTHRLGQYQYWSKFCLLLCNVPVFAQYFLFYFNLFYFIFFFRNFFEMVRFDFALDEDLNVYLMEVRELFVHECAT